MEKDLPVRPTDDTGSAATKNLRQEPQLDPPSGNSVTAHVCDDTGGMTLEQVIDLAGEFVHLHDLVMLHIENTGGFTDTGTYFRTVQPILDMLEVEIRVRCRPGMTQQQVKLIVQDWIDQEIKECNGKPTTPLPKKENTSEQGDI